MKTLNIETIVLKKGAHNSANEGTCIMEAVSMLSGESWSDHPACACPVASAFLRSWNDSLNDDDRQQLKQYIPLLVGSKSTPEIELRRSMMCIDWVIRVYTPTWLRLAKIVEEADALSNLKEIVTTEHILKAQPKLNKACDKGAAARDAARDVARDVAWDAARDAAWDVAWDVAWAAARAAAWAAARAAARDAAWAAARDAARDAAWAAARDAAWDVAWDAARDAAWDALKPTVTTLQSSAHDLVRRMLEAK